MRKAQVTNIKRAVCIMANELRKAGLTLSEAFKKAWRRIKQTMTVRAAGTTFENRQERLQFLSQFKAEELSITLEREPGNCYDSNAIGIVAHIKPLNRRTLIGYVPKGLAAELAKVMDNGVSVKAALKGIIGGYAYKEHYGMLLNISL